VSQQSVDQLRAELRNLGYLSRGIERWFALDPRRSRTFWLQLFTVAAKAALLIAPFVAAPLTFFLASRNHLTAGEIVLSGVLYGITAFLSTFLLVVLVAMALRLRAEAAIENPRIVTMLAILLATLLELGIGAWWYAYPRAPAALEAVVGISLLLVLFLIAVTALGAALVSFSIFETQHLPRVRRTRQGALLGGSLTLIVLALVAPLVAQGEPKEPERPQQIVLSPTSSRVALVAVDGLTVDVAAARRDLIDSFRQVDSVAPLRASSPPEEWATIGTGTLPLTHGVHAVEGVRLSGGAKVLQAISSADFVLRHFAPAFRLARREPLPPTARRRDFVWEVLASRGVPSVAVNWWTARSERGGALVSVPQEAVLARAATQAAGDRERFGTSVDAIALAELRKELASAPRFVTVYLPALDILLNRMELEPSQRVALSMRALDPLVSTVRELKQRGYDVILVGMPGEGQQSNGIVASTIALQRPLSVVDVAPTIFDRYGFPLSSEMRGKSRLAGSQQNVIPSFGARTTASGSDPELSPEYYENLKSLGYIR
jgi:hypothetical protein